MRELVAELERAGFVNRGGKGSHRNFVHPRVSKPITISGALGDDAKHYQVRAVKRAVEEIGALAVFFAHALAGLLSQDEQIVRAVTLAMGITVRSTATQESTARFRARVIADVAAFDESSRSLSATFTP